MITDTLAPDPGNTRSTILIVDDVPENLEVLGELLQPLYRVRGAQSGMRALQVACSSPMPDLILLDVMMPGMDGYAVFEALRADPRTRDIPVIFVTALDGVREEEKGLELGAVDYISKPLRPTIVLARVHTQLELKKARDGLRDQNTFLEAEIARRMGENLLIQEVSIRALARLAEIRDPETGNHLRRTQAYMNVLARRLALDPRHAATLTPHTIDLIVKSAPLHDIGKVGIPDYILLKPGKLTPEEWTIMQTHARLGAEAIEHAEEDAERPVPFLAIAKEIARHHHERWDGSGYPDRLAGEAIPIAARLMALADVFDALISRRVYKDPVSLDGAREMICAGRGTHFDPDVVDAFLADLPQFADIASRYGDEAAEAAAS
ncbi:MULTISPECIES: two-component system response regulator [Zoogloea]|uniref:HD-GYP domain-containing protein n=1 Tax=Zoogloea TaxID=349 RepID=UPI001FEAFD75|nr:MULTISPECIES: two-component system response regulator [Zoogloea]MDD2669679.1 two-component system response regulator [Zoogloea sp.]